MMLLDLFHADRDGPYVGRGDLAGSDDARPFRRGVTIDNAARYLAERMSDEYPTEVVQGELLTWLESRWETTESSLWLLTGDQGAVRVRQNNACRHCGFTHPVLPDDLCELGRLEYDAATALLDLIEVTGEAG